MSLRRLIDIKDDREGCRFFSRSVGGDPKRTSRGKTPAGERSVRDLYANRAPTLTSRLCVADSKNIRLDYLAREFSYILTLCSRKRCRCHAVCVPGILPLSKAPDAYKRG